MDLLCVEADLQNSGNRFESLEEGLIFEGITELHLEEILLTWDEVHRPKMTQVIYFWLTRI